MEDEAPPVCDVCSENTAVFWCDTCSTLLCKFDFSKHDQSHEIAPLDGQENTVDNGESEFTTTSKKRKAARNDDDDDDDNCDDDENAENKNASSKSNNGPQSRLQQGFSEERFHDVISMLDNMTPQKICSGLIRAEFILPSVSSTSSSSIPYVFDFEKEFSVSAIHQDSEIKKLFFTSLAQNSFAVVDNFLSHENNNTMNEATMTTAFLKSLEFQPSQQAETTMGQRGDFSLPTDSFPLKEIQNAVHQFKTDFLCCGIKLISPSSTNDESIFWKFANNQNYNNERKKYRDSVPNDGRLTDLRGMAARRVSIVVFLNTDENISWKIHSSVHGDEKAIPAKFGRMLIFLSGAVETQVVVANSEKGCCFCYASWLR